MINVRKGCFETNSSSMHSLAIWKKTKPYSDYDLKLNHAHGEEDFKLFRWSNEIEEAEYERYPFRILKTPIDKLRYLVGFYYRDGKWASKEIKEEFTNIVKKHTGCKKIQWYYQNYGGEKRYAYTTYGNDSGEFPIDFLKRKNISLEDFIFNPNYTLQVDGDEYQDFADMFKSNQINLENLEDISSGLEYWTDNYCTFYIEEARNKDWIDEDRTYLEDVEKDIEKVDYIWVHEFSDAKEEDFKAAAEFLNKYKDKKIIKLAHISHKDWVEKYLSWIK